MAVEAASFKIVILSISAGFNCPASEPTITPSITQSGEVVPLSVACPRITTAPLEPGWPSYNHPESSAYLSLFPCRFLLPVSYLLNPFLPPVSERDYALSANFLLWSSYHNNLSCACHIPVDHTKTFIKCLYHLAISDVYCHMADVLISSITCKTVKDKVSRL